MTSVAIKKLNTFLDQMNRNERLLIYKVRICPCKILESSVKNLYRIDLEVSDLFQ
jgi:hypothetical protein